MEPIPWPNPIIGNSLALLGEVLFGGGGKRDWRTIDTTCYDCKPTPGERERGARGFLEPVLRVALGSPPSSPPTPPADTAPPVAPPPPVLPPAAPPPADVYTPAPERVYAAGFSPDDLPKGTWGKVWEYAEGVLAGPVGDVIFGPPQGEMRPRPRQPDAQRCRMGEMAYCQVVDDPITVARGPAEPLPEPELTIPPVDIPPLPAPVYAEPWYVEMAKQFGKSVGGQVYGQVTQQVAGAILARFRDTPRGATWVAPPPDIVAPGESYEPALPEYGSVGLYPTLEELTGTSSSSKKCACKPKPRCKSGPYRKRIVTRSTKSGANITQTFHYVERYRDCRRKRA